MNEQNTNTPGSLTIEAKVLNATASKPRRVKANVLGGTAELILPWSGAGSLRGAASKLAVALDRDADVRMVAPTKDGYLFRAVKSETVDTRFEVGGPEAVQVKVSRA